MQQHVLALPPPCWYDNALICNDMRFTLLISVENSVEAGVPCAGSRFDCIAFMFPHCGKKGAIHLNRELMHKFFASARLLLSPQGQVLRVRCSPVATMRGSLCLPNKLHMCKLRAVVGTA